VNELAPTIPTPVASPEEVLHGVLRAQDRHLWIVTADQVPAWLDDSDPRITVVSHRDIFTDPGVLPTFNSHAIESQLHHIDGLAEHYLYANDDVFFGRPMRRDQFFSSNGLARIFRTGNKIDLGPWQPGDSPNLAAHKKVRGLLERDYGVSIANRFKHAVLPQRRTALNELETRYPDEFARTAASRFRHPSDLSVASSLVPNYLYLTGRAYAAPLRYSYVDAGDAGLAAKLQSWLESRALDSFCINDAGLVEELLDEKEQHTLITDFLAEYFPWPSRFEHPDSSDRPGPEASGTVAGALEALPRQTAARLVRNPVIALPQAVSTSSAGSGGDRDGRPEHG